jgi:hypothetical protein
MQLLFVGDSPRDEAVVPRIVKSIFAYANLAAFRAWKEIRLNRGGGYERKLLFAIEVARDAGLDGVVGTVDCDRATPGERLQELRAARAKHHADAAATAKKIAVGEAIPHTEAWLLDDPKAIRDVLGIPSTTELPNVRGCASPKDELHSIICASPRSDEIAINLLAEIASGIEETRCNHRRETGLQDFLADVKSELT